MVISGCARWESPLKSPVRSSTRIESSNAASEGPRASSDQIELQPPVLVIPRPRAFRRERQNSFRIANRPPSGARPARASVARNVSEQPDFFELTPASSFMIAGPIFRRMKSSVENRCARRRTSCAQIGRPVEGRPYSSCARD